MRYVRRELEAQLVRAMKSFPAVVLTGPRRAGKTYLLQHLFPEADYYSKLEIRNKTDSQANPKSE